MAGSGPPTKDDSLVQAALKVLNTPSPWDKAKYTAEAVKLWKGRQLRCVYEAGVDDTVWRVPDRPARADDKVKLVSPSEVRRLGKGGTLASRQAILHSLSHIESWAIDLSWDIIARFGSQPAVYPLPDAFFDDFVQVADDEARHFSLLASRLEALGSSYGDLPAHDGLWESACATAGSLPARLAVEHCVHEARGLDVLPSTIAKFRNNGDDESAALLEGVIYPEEVTHCGAGVRWLTHLHAAAHAAPEEKEEGGVSGPSGGVSWPTESASLAAEALSSISSISSSASSSDWRVDARRHATVEAWFHALARAHFRGPLKPPFNEEARDRAGFTKGWYMPLAAAGGGGGEDQSQQEQNESTGLRPDADRSSNDAASGGRRASASAGGAGAAGTADKAAVEFASLAVAGQA